MELSSILHLFQDYTFQIVALGGISLGILSGATGTFAVLRKQSLLGDGIAHASLAGIALAFMITQNKQTEVLLFGAVVVGLLATLIMQFFSKHSTVNFESAIALVMASFFGLGLVLLTEIQKYPNSNQAGLNRFLFGQAATILKRDVWAIVFIMFIVLTLMIIFWKELKIYSFDPTFTKTLGFNEQFLNILLSTFTVASVIMGIQMVGVVLMSALLVAPPVAARQWTRSLEGMTLLSIIFGALSGLTGSIISSTVDKFPAGPAIVLVASTLVIVSILFAPQRGLIYRRLEKKRVQKEMAADMLIIHYFTHHDLELDAAFSKSDFEYKTKQEHPNKEIEFNKLFKNLVKRRMILHLNDEMYKLSGDTIRIYFEKGAELSYDLHSN